MKEKKAKIKKNPALQDSPHASELLQLSSFRFASSVMQEMGLEPTHSHLRQILSLMRLPFRHSCVFNSCSLS